MNAILNTRLLPLVTLISVFAASVHASENSMDAAHSAIPVQDCTMEPSEIVDVGSAVPGVVEAIHASRSDLVEKSAIIVELESSVEQASLELARVRAGQDSAIQLRRERVRFGYLTQKREQELLSKSAISRHEVDKSKTDTRIAELQVRQEQDNKAISELEYRRAQMVLQQRRIRSPVEGVVMERFKSVGEFVDDEPLVRVAQLDPLHVEVIVPVDYLGRIVPGMQAEVTTGLQDSGAYRATVERVDRVADAASGTYGVRLSLPNPDYRIPAGLRCQLSFLPQSLDEPEQVADKLEFAPAVAEVTEAPPAKDKAPVEPPELCYSVGPVGDESTARQLVEKLQQRTDTLRLRTASDSVETSYLVLAAEQPNDQGTNQLLARLEEAGITDRFLFFRGKNKGRISLGLYNTPASAHKREQALKLEGFDTEIQPRRKEVMQYWLDVALTGALTSKSDLADELQSIAAPLATSATFEPMACYPELASR